MQTDQLLAGVVMLSVLGLLIAWGLGTLERESVEMALRVWGVKIKMLRRTILAALPASLAAGRASAQAYPAKPITIVVPFAAGGPTDLMARIVGERMAKELGQQFIIDNTTGAAGTIAVGKVGARRTGRLHDQHRPCRHPRRQRHDLQEPDLQPADRPRADRAPAANPMLVVTSDQVPVRTLKELVELPEGQPATRSPAAPPAWARARISARSPSSPRPAPSTSSCPIAAPARRCRTSSPTRSR